MSPQPQTRTNELQSQLTGYIERKERPDPFTLNRLLAESKKLPDWHSQVLIHALAYAADENHSEAVHWFHLGVNERDLVVARNYLSYLAHTARNEAFCNESIRIAGEFNDPALLGMAAESAYFLADPERYQFLIRRKVSLSGDPDYVENSLSYMHRRIQNMEDFIVRSGMDYIEVNSLSHLVLNVAEKHSLSVVSARYDGDIDGSSLIARAHTDDSELVAVANFDLAGAMAESGLLDNKNAVAWMTPVLSLEEVM